MKGKVIVKHDSHQWIVIEVKLTEYMLSSVVEMGVKKCEILKVITHYSTTDDI